ncbi:MAG: hypothetical protein JXM69_06155 [Anaerolineae bacterium]|nr:hypothetical protein [Anaerolineae bacterium]
MPQLVKGGKHTFGWARVGDTGRIIIPPAALAEYHLQETEKLILVPGSRTSGGFGLGSPESVKKSPLGAVLDAHLGLREFQSPEGEVIKHNGKPYSWVELRHGGVTISPETLKKYGVGIGAKLLVIRGSGLAVGFAVRGPIVAEAKKHPELEVFEPEI